MNVRPFHLALPTEDLELTRLIYCDILGCETGRTSEDWKGTMIIEPSVRVEGTPGEQRTVFFQDPNGYALEFKSFANDDDLFATFDS